MLGLLAWTFIAPALPAQAQGAAATPDLSALKRDYRRPPLRPIENGALVDLGHDLFFDPKISASGKTACASCHIGGDFDGLAWDLGNPSTIPLPITPVEYAEAQAILVTPSRALAAAVEREIRMQAQKLSRREILAKSVREMRLITVDSLDGALDIANEYAPEHLILQVLEPRRWLAKVAAAGAVFLGAWSPEPMGDYCSGPNHTLPTYGYARAYSGLSLEDFQKRITVQELTPAGLKALSGTACTLAALEGLDAHAAAVNIRLAALGSPAA